MAKRNIRNKKTKDIVILKILDFPNYRQRLSACGSTVVSAVLSCFGIDRNADMVEKETGCTFKYGTPIRGIIKVLKKYGLKIKKGRMDIGEIKRWIDKGCPVILLIQAYARKKSAYRTTSDNGHYVVAIGYGRKRFRKKTNGTNGGASNGKSNGHKESQENVFFWKKIIIFEDPCSIFRAYLFEDELDERWHGWSDHGTFTGGEPLVLMKFGIAVYGKKPKHGSKKLTKMP